MTANKFKKWNRMAGMGIIALALFLLVSISACAQTGTELQHGRDLLKKGDFIGAAQAGRKATEQDNTKADAWMLLGHALFEMEDFDGAEKALTKIAPLTDDRLLLMETSHLLGIIYLMNQGEVEKAQKCFQEEIAHAREVKNPADEALAHYYLGLVYQRKGEDSTDDALKEFQAAVKLEPHDEQNLPYRTSLAEELYVTSDTKAALTTIQSIEGTVTQTKNVQVKSTALFSCGKLYTFIGEMLRKSTVQTEMSLAHDYFKKADSKLQEGFRTLRSNKNIHDWYAEALAYKSFGKLVEIQGNILAATGRYQQGLESASKSGHHSELVIELRKRITILSPLAKRENIFGTIDIGSKGVKAVLVSTVVDDKGVKHATELYRRTINTNLNSSRDANNNASAEAIQKTALAVRDLIDEMKRVREKPFRVTSFFVAGSSSLAEIANRPELAKQIFEATKKQEQAPASFLNATAETATPFINESDELKYAIYGSVPRDDWDTASLIDIGSGNGRWGFTYSGTEGSSLVNVEIKRGSVSLAKETTDNRQGNEDYVTALERIAEEQIGFPLRRNMKANPNFRKRPKVYLIGGAAYALVTLMHPEAARDEKVTLTRKDLLDFYKLVKAGSTEKPYRPDLSEIKDPDTLEAAKKQIEDVLHKVFQTRDELLSASILLRTLATNALSSEQTIIFPRLGGWAVGMAEQKYFSDQAKSEADKLKPVGEN